MSAALRDPKDNPILASAVASHADCKDLADIARLLEVSPHLRPLVPDEILAKIE